MNPLVEKLMSSANLDEAMAQKAVEVVASFLEEKLPEPAKSLATKAVNGLDIGDMAGDALGKIGGMF